MKLHKLRIAWSALCISACVLLIAWWMRSYWRLDVIKRVCASNSTTLRVDAGLITFIQTESPGPLFESGYWSLVVDNASWGMNFWQFDWALRSNLFVIRTPIWAPALAFALLAWAPWIRWSTRFSLRALLIATTLLAILLAMIVAFQ